MFGGPLMLLVNMSIADTIHQQSDKVVTVVKIEATGKPNLMTALLFYQWWIKERDLED